MLLATHRFKRIGRYHSDTCSQILKKKKGCRIPYRIRFDHFVFMITSLHAQNRSYSTTFSAPMHWKPCSVIHHRNQAKASRYNFKMVPHTNTWVCGCRDIKCNWKDWQNSVIPYVYGGVRVIHLWLPQKWLIVWPLYTSPPHSQK